MGPEEETIIEKAIKHIVENPEEKSECELKSEDVNREVIKKRRLLHERLCCLAKYL